MGILNIRPAVRGGSKVIINIAGTSGSGKTYTALLLARGMVDKASEIGFLDTENKRGSLYADILDGQFQIADLYPPFSPRRYGEAIREWQEQGIKVLVIDSVSHEFEGEGGVEDIANAGDTKIPNWKLGKKEHKWFMNQMLQCNMNLINCIRAREKTDFKVPSKPVSLGIQPICEKNFMFEATASMMMENEGKTQKFLKLPSFLKSAFGDGNNYIGIDTGKRIIEWLEIGEKENPVVTKIKSEMLMACEHGLDEVLKVWKTVAPIWKKLSSSVQKDLEDHKNVCKESALEYEKQAKQAEQTPAEILADTQAELEAKGEQTKLNLP